MSKRVTLCPKLKADDTAVLHKGRPEIVVEKQDGEYVLMSMDEALLVKKWIVDVCGAYPTYDRFNKIMAVLSGETERYWVCPTCGMENYVSVTCTGCLTRRGEAG